MPFKSHKTLREATQYTYMYQSHTNNQHIHTHNPTTTNQIIRWGRSTTRWASAWAASSAASPTARRSSTPRSGKISGEMRACIYRLALLAWLAWLGIVDWSVLPFFPMLCLRGFGPRVPSHSPPPPPTIHPNTNTNTSACFQQNTGRTGRGSSSGPGESHTRYHRVCGEQAGEKGCV